MLDEISLCASAAALPRERVEEFASFAQSRGQSLVAALVERAAVTEEQLLASLAELLEIEFTRGQGTEIEAAAVAALPPGLATEFRVVPVRSKDDCLYVADNDPFNWRKLDELSQLIGRRVERILCPSVGIDRLLKAHYGLAADTVDRLLSGRQKGDSELQLAKTTDLSEEQAANEPTVVNLVNQILTEAIRANATDIHFECYENKYRVRYRIDGMLEDVSLPVSVKLLRLALVSRIKIMSNLDITEKRLPQDGRCQVSLAGAEYDLRVSILPGVHGEAVVIRLQSRQMVQLDLKALGFAEEDQRTIHSFISRPHGLVLVTGPTGSGKTTTLYTCLSKINTPPVKIITIEDPIEYRMENILQMQVHDDIGFTFARALRSVLRHDPDVILVGEIRDRETADIAIRSALTGHLVFATLHTNDAASAFTRLLDLGIEPFLVASSVFGVVAQRLVRTICPHCKQQISASAMSDVLALGNSISDLLAGKQLFEGQKCERCRFTGYRGRTAIAEVLTATPEVRRRIQQREPAERIKEVAVREGMRSLRDAAVAALLEGRTTLAEVLRVTQEDL